MPQQSIAQVLQQLAKGQVAPLYLLFGSETYLIHEYTAACSERILGTASRDFNYDVFYADADTLQEALSLARTLPMMAAYRVVVLHDVHQLHKADLSRLEAYADTPSESTALLCSSQDDDPKKLPPALRRNAVTLACKRLEGTQLRQWVVRTVERQGCSIADDAVDGFLQEQQNDLWTLAREIDKLCTYAGETQHIRLEDVQTVCQALRLQSIFALSEAIGGHRPSHALSVLNELLHQGEPPLLVFSMIVRHLRLLWSVRQLSRQRRSLAEIAKTLHIPQRVCRQLVSQCGAFPAARLQQLYSAALAADLAFKTTNKPPRAILEGLILELCEGVEMD
jgi:DNA polymerase-3 subunit delta